MTPCSFGDVILVPFPFTDQSAAKKRPAVVISSERYHRERPDVLVMAITSQVRQQLAVGEAIVDEWKAAGLLKASVIKPVITTLERSLIIRKLGRLSDAEQQRIHESLTAILG